MTLEKPRTPRNAKYLDWVGTLACSVPNCGRKGEPHHEGTGGMGLKCSDYRAIPLCREHHTHYHMAGKRSFWEFWGVNPENIIKRLNILWAENVKKRKETPK